MGEVIERLQASNPQIAARMLAPMTRWRRYAVGQETMRAELERLAAIDPLPKDVFEVLNRSHLGTERRLVDRVSDSQLGHEG